MRTDFLLGKLKKRSSLTFYRKMFGSIVLLLVMQIPLSFNEVNAQTSNEAYDDEIHRKLNRSKLDTNVKESEYRASLEKRGIANNRSDMVADAVTFPIELLSSYTYISKKLGIGIENPAVEFQVMGVSRSGVDISEFTEISHSGSHGYINTVGDGNLDFRHDGITKMSLTSDGNIGIGIINPTRKLAVNGNVQVSDTLFVEKIQSGKIVGEREIATEAPVTENHRGNGTQAGTGLVYRVLANPAAGDPIFQVRSSGQAVRFFVEHDGWTGSSHNSAWFGGARANYFASNVGIGTSNPGDYKLAVSGNMRVSDTLFVNKIRSGKIVGEREIATEAPLTDNHRGSGIQSATGLVYRVLANPAAGDPIFQVRSSGQAVRFFVEHDGWTGSSHNSAWFGGAKANYFASNVGIGTSNPGDYKLAVSGNMRVSDTLFVNKIRSGKIVGEREIATEAPSTENHRGSGTQSATGLVYRVLTNPAAGDPIFQVRSSGQAVRFFVEHDGWTGSLHNSAWFGGARTNYFAGNVGIGTDNPGDSKLAVNGTIKTQKVYVTADSWSDFVFEDTYELRELSEVEKYIKENKHLPDVPSKEEVVKNGVELGEMDAVLLQKIEELTLYMIELEKKVKVLQKTNDELSTLLKANPAGNK